MGEVLQGPSLSERSFFQKSPRPCTHRQTHTRYIVNRYVNSTEVTCRPYHYLCTCVTRCTHPSITYTCVYMHVLLVRAVSLACPDHNTSCLLKYYQSHPQVLVTSLPHMACLAFSVEPTTYSRENGCHSRHQGTDANHRLIAYNWLNPLRTAVSFEGQTTQKFI